MAVNVDSKESGSNDLLSWDGRKTADSVKVSNDGLWTWDGSDWQPRKTTKKQTSHNNKKQETGVRNDSVQIPKSLGQTEVAVNQTPSTDIGIISPDGLHQWDGSKWIPVELTKLSDDGYWMWNGVEWIPAPEKNHSSLVEQFPMTVTQSQTRRLSSPNIKHSPLVDANVGISYFHAFAKRGGKTFYAPLIAAGLVFILMFTPFLTFEHDELTNSEEGEVCVLIYQSFQSVSNDDEFVESDDLECPMNGYASSIYSLETISNFEIDDTESESDWFVCANGEEIPSNYVNDGKEDCSDGSDESAADVGGEEEMFVIAMLMLFASPFVYILFAFSTILSIWLKKYPIMIGVLQLLYVLLFVIVSLGGSMSDGSFELSVHGNFAGIGIYLVGFVSIGYLIPK
jgi:hypothetical protein